MCWKKYARTNYNVPISIAVPIFVMLMVTQFSPKRPEINTVDNKKDK